MRILGDGILAPLQDTPTIYTSDNLLMALMFVRIQFVPRLIAEIWLIYNRWVLGGYLHLVGGPGVIACLCGNAAQRKAVR